MAEHIVRITVPEVEEQVRQKLGRDVKIGDDVLVYWENEPGSISKAPAKVVAIHTSTLINAIAFLDGSNQAHLGGAQNIHTKWVTSVNHKSTVSGGFWWDWS